MKVQNEMATRIAIDTVSAANSLKGLQNAVSAATSAWKAQETALRSAGDSLGAARTKYEGLGNVIDSQKRKIEELKSRQSGLNVENQKDAETYLKLQKNIDTATKQLSSYEAQQSRAKQAVGYHTSGLADLQKGYRQSNELSKSFVDRLQAEGRASEANKAKLSGLKQGISNLSAQYKVQESELKRIASETGKTSDAYKKQQTRLNETATAMAKTKTEARELENQLNKKPASFLGGVKEKLLGVNKSAEKTESVFKRVFSGVFWGEVAHGAASSALNLIKAGLGGITKAGNEFNKEQQVMNATWTTLTGNASKGASFVKSINNMSTAFGQSNDLVNELDQQFYHVLDKKGPTEQLTKSVLTMADTLGMSAENTKRLGLNFTHMMSSSKMQLGDFNMISDQLPMFGERLLDYERKMQHNNALSMSELRDQMSAGKISAKDAEAVMNGLGKKYKDASENMMKTATGAERSIKARFGALSGDLAKPFTTMQSPIFEAVSKWVSDPKTEKKFTEVGKAASKGFQTITTALTKALDIKDGPKAMNKFMDGLAKSIESISDVIASHSKQIVGFFKGLWSTVKILGKVGAGFFKGLVGAVEAVANPLAKMVSHNKKISGLSGALGELAKHTSALETLGKVLAGVFVTKKIVGFTSSLVTAGIKVKDFSKGLIFKPTVDPETGKRQLTLFAKTVKGTAKLIGKSLKWTAKIAGKVAKGAIKGLYAVTRSTGRLIGKSLKWTAKIGKSAASKAISGLQKTAKASGKLIVKSLEFTAKVSTKAAVLALNGLKTVTGLVGKAFLQMTAFMMANPFVAIAAAIVAVGVAFYELYKHNKKFKKFIDGIGKSITKFTKGALKGIKKFFKSFKKGWDNFWSGLGKGINKTWKGITGGISKQYTKINKGLSSFSKGFKKSWNKHWNDSKKSLSDATKKMDKTFTGWGKDMSKNWDSWKKGFSKNWNKHWNSTKDYLSDRWDDMKKSSSKWGTSISKWFSGWGDDFKKSWSSLIGSVKKMFSGLWDDMKKLAGGGINAVSGVINTGIKGVNGVVHLFGGKENTISSIPKVKFATGTGSLGATSFRRAITQITPAIVNDEVGARNPELIFRKSTGNVEFLKGNNAQTVLFPGDEVANATDSAMLAPMLGLTPFAKGGIGSFFGGLWNGVTGFVSDVSKKMKELWTTGKKIVSNPGKALESLMPFSNGGAKGFFPTMVKGGYNFAKKQANTWWSTLWSMVDFDGAGGDASGLLGAVEKYGKGKSYVWGATGPDSFDCSGLVMYALKHAFGIDFPHFSGSQIAKTQHVSAANAKPGDLIGNNEHIGVYAGNGKYWSAMSPSSHPNIGMSSVSSFPGTPIYGRVRGLSSGDDKDASKGVKANSGLEKTIKSQVGGGFWKMISKLSSLFGEDIGGSGAVPAGDAIGRWRPDVKKALDTLGLSTSSAMIAKVLRQINTESGGNPKAMGGTDGLSDGHAEGLMQVKPPTFKAYHLKGHNNIWDGYDNMLAGLNYAKHRYGSGLGFLGNGHGYENGGIISRHGLYEIAEHNKPEMVIPLDVTKRSRAHELIQEAVARTTPNEPSKKSVPMNDENSKSLQNLEAKFDTLLAMFAKLLGLNADQLEAIKNSGQLDMAAWYRKQARDQANADFQGL